MKADTKLIIQLKKELLAPIGLCKEALEKYDNDVDKAREYIKMKMMEQAQKFTGRATKNGVIATYSHGEAQNIGVMVQVECQTDFVARNEEFRKFAHEIALQIAAMDPKYISVEDIPEEELNKLREMYRDELKDSGKPAEIIERIVDGKIKKWMQNAVLLEQEYFREEGKKIKELLDEYKAKLGENIKIVRFVRWQL